MPSTIHPLGSSLADSLRELGRRPTLLASLLVLIHAIVSPYVGIIHDSQLYSGLVLNRIDPNFLSDDLFFRYGSQDKYSLFSPIMAPLVVMLGNKVAFLLAYLVSSTLMFFALTKLVLKLWPESPAAVVGLLYLAIVHVPYGGYVPLHVVEQFLSARVPACALTLWGLVEILDRRYVRGGLALAFAFGIHPLMTLPGLMILAIVFLARRWGTLGVVIPTVISLVAFGALLATPSVATRVFGDFDEEWLVLTQRTNCYMFPQEWYASQWFWNLFAIFGLSVAAWYSRGADADRGRVLAGAAMIGFAGFFGTLLFSNLPYALLLKGQAYRWLWLPMALTPPAFLHLAWSAWQTKNAFARLAAIGLATFLVVTTYYAIEMVCLVFFLPVTYYAMIMFAKESRGADKLCVALAGSILAGIFLWGGYRVWSYFSLCTAIKTELTPINVYDLVTANLCVGVIFPLAVLVVALGGRRLANVCRPWTLVAASVAVQAVLFAWMNTESYQSLNPKADELRFVEEFLGKQKAEENRSLSIYCNYGRLYQYWIEWGTRSYYDCFQLAGFVFNRETAVEGKRRAKLVGPFEAAVMASGRSEVIPQGVKDDISAWLEADVDDPQPPTEADLIRLAQEPSIDFIVLFRTHFDHLAVARRGDVSIYDCRSLRETFAHIPKADSRVATNNR